MLISFDYLEFISGSTSNDLSEENKTPGNKDSFRPK